MTAEVDTSREAMTRTYTEAEVAALVEAERERVREFIARWCFSPEEDGGWFVPRADMPDAIRALSIPSDDALATKREITNELGNRIRITIEGPTSTSENVVTPAEATALQEALGQHLNADALARRDEQMRREGMLKAAAHLRRVSQSYDANGADPAAGAALRGEAEFMEMLAAEQEVKPARAGGEERP